MANRSGRLLAGRVLVTGGSGFLGRRIVDELRPLSRDIRSLQRTQTGPPGIPTVVGDIRDPSTVARALEGTSVVIHAAGLAHVFGRADTAPFMEVNEHGTSVVARSAVAAGVRHLILVSSVAVHGGATPNSAGEPNCRPTTPYAVSKLASENRAAEAVHGSGTRLTILRMATIYGEGDRGNVQRLLQAIDSGRFVAIGPGVNRKSLLYVRDAARACVMPIGEDGAAVETFDVSADPVQMREVVAGLAEALERRIPGWHIPSAAATLSADVFASVMPGRGGRVRQTIQKWLSDEVYSGARFAERFSFTPQIGLAEGLRRQVRWWRSSTTSKGSI